MLNKFGPVKASCWYRNFLPNKYPLKYSSSDVKIHSLKSDSIWFPPIGASTGIETYNSVVRQRVNLVFPRDSHATWFSCGPSSYDKPHLGHAYNYVQQDIIQRILRKHFQVNLVTAMNIPEIEDDIISESIQSGKYWREISFEYERNFFKALQKLNVKEPNVTLHVNQYMEAVIAFIVKLVEKKVAYVTSDGTVYFNVKKYPNYGKLDIQNNINSKISSATVGDCDLDFSLWRPTRYSREPAWIAPWGEGRPTRPTECSALASALFGSNIDIYAGEAESRFPYHENQDAQSCVFHETNQWVNFWIHVGNVHLKGNESNKLFPFSTKHITVPIDDMLEDYDSDVFRMACLLTNYKKPLEYSNILMKKASDILREFREFQQDCSAYLNGNKPPANINRNILLKNLEHTVKEVHNGFCDDFNTGYVVNILVDQVTGLSRCMNNENFSGVNDSACLDLVMAAYNYILEKLEMFGLTTIKPLEAPLAFEDKINVEHLVSGIIGKATYLNEAHVALRCPNLFQVCDEIRNCLKKHGIKINKESSHSSLKILEQPAMKENQ